MSTILNRDESGQVSLAAGDGNFVSFNIPKNQSALSMVVANQFKNGDVADSDGWIYVNGVKSRKWFTNCSVNSAVKHFIRVWSPKFDDLRLCEEKRWKAVQHRYNFYLKNWENIRSVIAAAQPFCCIFNNGPKANGYVEFRSHSSGGIGWNWCVGAPPNYNYGVKPVNLPVNQEVGDLWFAFEKRSREIGFRSQIFEHIFRRAVDNKYSKILNETDDSGYFKIKTVHAIINGRDYWFQRTQSKYPEEYVEMLSAPESTQQFVETI